MLQPSSGPGNHAVHFYEPHNFPTVLIAEFLYDGLILGESAVIIATTEHAFHIEEALEKLSVDIPELQRRGLWFAVDTGIVLRALQSQASSESVFDVVLGTTIRQAQSNAPTGRLRIYGGLVNVLFREKNTNAVLALEIFGNQLVSDRTVQIQCAYSVDTFPDAGSAADFAKICLLHDQIHAPLEDPSDWRYRVAFAARENLDKPV